MAQRIGGPAGRTRSQARPANVAGQQFSGQSAHASASTQSADDILQSVVPIFQQQQQMLMAMADTQLRAAGTPAPPSAANARALSVAKRIQIPVLASPDSLDIVALNDWKARWADYLQFTSIAPFQQRMRRIQAYPRKTFKLRVPGNHRTCMRSNLDLSVKLEQKLERHFRQIPGR